MQKIDGDKLAKELEDDRYQCVKALNRPGLPAKRREFLDHENDIYMSILSKIRSGEFDAEN